MYICGIQNTNTSWWSGQGGARLSDSVKQGWAERDADGSCREDNRPLDSQNLDSMAKKTVMNVSEERRSMNSTYVERRTQRAVEPRFIYGSPARQ